MGFARLILAIAAAALFSSCSSDMTRGFDIRTIDTHGKEVPCVALINGQIHTEGDNKPFLTNQPNERLTLSFQEENGRPKRYELKVIALKKDGSGKFDINSYKLPRESHPYVMTETQARQLRFDDPEKHLLILRKNVE